MVRRFAVLCASALIVCAAACSADEPAAVPTPSATPTPSSIFPSKPTSAGPTAPPRADPEVACGGEPFDPKKVRPLAPGAPRYAGKGLHPAELVHMHFVSDPYSTELPTEWNASLGAVPGAAQLLICEYRDDSYRSKTVETCRYGGTDGSKSTSKSLSARYRYRLFEAGTGRPIATFTLMGSLTTCPATTVGGVSENYYERVTDEDLAAKLRPFIVGPARRN
jgi:hypothetical protein